MEEGMPWRQRRFFEFDTNPVNWRPEEVRPMPRIFYDPVKRLLQLNHANTGFHLCDGRLLRL